ncbi:winged helix-turn-helix domain-containing protein [Saccharopolyspora sp. WRP15-2]|uniref:Winged helix-turn-helix domain-containing protein n=1 Tax=Saccharopolyspora oryzae TaxID=2997343 RepID=A0ABT4UX49_9PSEU|nr:winged helix-turn-helix domain-containing protein [Saccharopolyspora oryzae]MDA3625667.1 winged helix-turn-helix domain-containing protein [Saccharopolyspora oryzae]
MIGNYLRSWGLSPQKPIRRAYEQDLEAVHRWLEEDYPAIAACARREGAMVLWLDQTGIRSDAAVGRTWAPAGQTQVVGKTGNVFSVNAMCAIGNKGEVDAGPHPNATHAQWGRRVHVLEPDPGNGGVGTVDVRRAGAWSVGGVVGAGAQWAWRAVSGRCGPGSEHTSPG